MRLRPEFTSNSSAGLGGRCPQFPAKTAPPASAHVNPRRTLSPGLLLQGLLQIVRRFAGFARSFARSVGDCLLDLSHHVLDRLLLFGSELGFFAEGFELRQRASVVAGFDRRDRLVRIALRSRFSRAETFFHAGRVHATALAATGHDQMRSPTRWKPNIE